MTEALHALGERGLISYGRGQITVLDRKGLDARRAKPMAFPRPNIAA